MNKIHQSTDEIIDHLKYVIQAANAYRQDIQDDAVLVQAAHAIYHHGDLSSQSAVTDDFNAQMKNGVEELFTSLVDHSIALEDLNTALREMADAFPAHRTLCFTAANTVFEGLEETDRLIETIYSQEQDYLLANNLSNGSSIYKDYNDVYIQYVYTEKPVDKTDANKNAPLLRDLCFEISRTCRELVDDYATIAQVKLGYFHIMRSRGYTPLMPMQTAETGPLTSDQKLKITSAFVDSDISRACAIIQRNGHIMKTIQTVAESCMPARKHQLGIPAQSLTP